MFCYTQGMKLIMQPAISLDGFIAKLDGDSESWVNQADEARYQQVVRDAGAVIVGRTTYEQYKTDFDSYDDVVVFVCTNNKEFTDTSNVKHLSGNAIEIVDAIKSNHSFNEVIVCGGGEVNGMLADAGLVDEIVISVQSAVLGEGIPLFGIYKPRLNLELISVDQQIPGVVQNHYLVRN
ncbi:MAG: dihydrofolate reductase [Candidatus Saccharibacteria bacterium]|nr:dihydrofolate reductase [Candidatus Saccharibacteria bacterium]